MRKEDISASLDENTLTISGERKREEKKQEGETYRSERYFGRFQRSVTLSHAVDADTANIKAEMHQGVLKLRLPKSQKAKPKQIQIT